MNFEEAVKDINTMYKAFRVSKNHRSYTVSSAKFEENVFANLKKLQEELLSDTYEVSGYTEFEVLVPKRRNIKACKFRDKIVQHVLCDNVIQPLMSNICIRDNYAGQIGKGTGMAKKRLVENMKAFDAEYGQHGYFYRGDIHKYYYSINHEIAKDVMQYYMPADTHGIITKFIDSTGDNEEEDTGLALGNQINTYVSCLYLDGLDKFVTGELGIKYYGRYADDFYLIHYDKAYVKYCEYCITEYLKTLRLNLNPKSQVIPIKNGISYLGFHFWIRDGNMIIKLDNSKKRAQRRRFNRMLRKVATGDMQIQALEKSYRSWREHASFCTDKSIFNYYNDKINRLKRLMEEKK